MRRQLDRDREGEEERNVEMGLKPTIIATVSTSDSTTATARDISLANESVTATIPNVNIDLT